MLCTNNAMLKSSSSTYSIPLGLREHCESVWVFSFRSPNIGMRISYLSLLCACACASVCRYQCVLLNYVCGCFSHKAKHSSTSTCNLPHSSPSIEFTIHTHTHGVNTKEGTHIHSAIFSFIHLITVWAYIIFVAFDVSHSNKCVCHLFVYFFLSWDTCFMLQKRVGKKTKMRKIKTNGKKWRSNPS